MSIWDRIELQQVQTVLCVGFGNGDEIAHLSQKLGKTGTIYGVEISSKLIEVAQQRLTTIPQKLILQIAKAEQLPFDRESMDLVFCKIVLSEISVWKNVIVEAARVLKHNGRVAFVDFISYNPDWLTISGDTHAGFDLKEVRQVLHVNGMHIVQLDPAIGKGTIGALDGERIWVETFLIEAEKE